MHQYTPDHLPSQRQPLASEEVVVSAPMSFAGSAVRLWKLAAYPAGGGGRAAVRGLVVIPLVVFVICTVWMFVLGWYCVFGVLLVPYRLIRRGARKRKREELRHREMMAALQQGQLGTWAGHPASKQQPGPEERPWPGTAGRR